MMHPLVRPAVAAAVAASLMSAPASAGGTAFPTPGAAADALVEALESLDQAAIAGLVGAGNEGLLLSGDRERDRALARDFLSAYGRANDLSRDADGRYVLSVGIDAWPFPVPIAPTDDGRWRFDAAAGREALRTRTIGRNELDVIGLMRTYVEVQAAYRQIDFDGDGVMEFADAILSDAGVRNGLYWPGDETGASGPLGEAVALASDGGYGADGELRPPEPYAGYLFRILTRQGASAPGGALDYVVDGNMIAGHALLAYPADYGASGIMSFLVGENGVVYEADLGEETLARARAIEAFDPGEDWGQVGE